MTVELPELAKLKAEDLALLDDDSRRFLARERPGTDALLLVLGRPRDVVLRDWHFAQVRERLIAESTNAGLLDAPGLALADQPSAMMAVATATVARAIMGDLSAAQVIYDRVEGRPGNRKGETDGDQGQRVEMLRSLEALVRTMHERPTMQRPGDTAIDVTPKANGHDDKDRGANGHDEGEPPR